MNISSYLNPGGDDGVIKDAGKQLILVSRAFDWSVVAGAGSGEVR